MVVGASGLSAWARLPVSIAWSTPGGALLATAGAVEGGFSAAVGAFIVCAVLIVIAGLFRPLGRAVAAIPAPLANAMLSGVIDRKSTRLNSSTYCAALMPSSALNKTKHNTHII